METLGLAAVTSGTICNRPPFWQTKSRLLSPGAVVMVIGSVKSSPPVGSLASGKAFTRLSAVAGGEAGTFRLLFASFSAFWIVIDTVATFEAATAAHPIAQRIAGRGEVRCACRGSARRSARWRCPWWAE